MKTNTNDHISRQAAIDALNKMKIYRPLDSDRYVISDCLNKIVNLPSVQERKGRWIGKDDDSERYDSYWCDQCHHEITVDAKRFCDIGFVIEDFKFCPNCGADMEGEQDDND